MLVNLGMGVQTDHPVAYGIWLDRWHDTQKGPLGGPFVSVSINWDLRAWNL